MTIEQQAKADPVSQDAAPSDAGAAPQGSAEPAPAITAEEVEELKALRAEKVENEKAKLSAKEREEREVEQLRRDKLRLQVENEVMRAELPEELSALIIPAEKQTAQQAVAAFAKVFQKAVKAQAEKVKNGPAGAPVNPATGEPNGSSGAQKKAAANAAKPDRYFMLASGRKG